MSMLTQHEQALRELHVNAIANSHYTAIIFILFRLHHHTKLDTP